MAEKCKECGCKCARCTHVDQQHDMHLHAEIENLRQRLMERDNHIVTMETQFLSEADKFPNGELASMKEELLIWQEKYSRLYDAHKRVQKVNQNLEDKLLRIVDKCETEKSAFTKDIATLSHRLADANYTIHRLTQDNEKYRNDVNLAIQLLQCKPANFVGQKYDSLPSEVQAKVRTYVAQKRRSSDTNPPDVKSITVPISTFPPTAMVYNVTKPAVEKHSDDESDESKPPVDIVSAAIMAKVLEDREKERIFAKHCDTCTCHRSILLVDAETQTTLQDVFSCNDCRTRYTQNGEMYMENSKAVDRSSQSKEHLNSVMHAAYHEASENAISNGKAQYHSNSNCTKNLNCQHASTRDKFVTRNGRLLENNTKDETRANINSTSLSKKKSRRGDTQLQAAAFQNQNDNINKQAISQKLNDACINSKANVDKVKQGRVNKRCDLQTDAKASANYWNKLEKKSSSSYNQTDPENTKDNFGGKEQSHIDIINDRLWKNEWMKLKSQVNSKEANSTERVNSDVEIDVINDRVWKNDRSTQEARHTTQVTVIEVKNVGSIGNQSDSGQMEVATSPSFSSDSMVISTSDPSSTSSDLVQSLAGAQLIQNINNSRPNGHNRLPGPRNCLVRVTPGSKNILLDNAGHYKTVLYTSGNNKPNTALVHTKKSPRSGSDRSMSTSSEENSPVLLHDNNQLQRVAEWVQSSVRMESSAPTGYTKLKSTEDVVDSPPSLIYTNESRAKPNSVDHNVMLCNNSQEKRRGKSVIDIANFGDENLNNELNDLCFTTNTDGAQPGKDEDLITFDVPNEDEIKPIKKTDNVDYDYDVKITKEMEETYLKLAASLDPAALSLSSTDSADLTIEKYRKDYKKLHVQRNYEKGGYPNPN